MVVWGIASREDQETLELFRDSFDIQMPILMDQDSQVFNQYRLQSPFPTGAYPHDWIVGRDGTIVYFNNRFDADRMIETIEAQLDEE